MQRLQQTSRHWSSRLPILLALTIERHVSSYACTAANLDTCHSTLKRLTTVELAVCTEFALQTSLWLASQTANVHIEPYLLCCYYDNYSNFFC